MAQQQQQQSRFSAREEMIRAMQAAGQSDRDPYITSDTEALIYAAGVVTGQLDPTVSLLDQKSRTVDLSGYGERQVPVTVARLQLNGPG